MFARSVDRTTTIMGLVLLYICTAGNDECSEFASELNDPCSAGEDPCFDLCVPDGSVCCERTSTGVEYCDRGEVCIPDGCRVATSPGSGSSGGGSGPTCSDAGEDCSANRDCCSGSLCVNFDNSYRVCADTCRSNSECNSGCCATLDSGNDRICASSEFCD